MAGSRLLCTLKKVASSIGENPELIEEITANTDNIAEGELVSVRDVNEDDAKRMTKN